MTYCGLSESGRMIIDVRQRDGCRGGNEEAIRSAVHVPDLHVNGVHCLYLESNTNTLSQIQAIPRELLLLFLFCNPSSFDRKYVIAFFYFQLQQLTMYLSKIIHRSHN